MKFITFARDGKALPGIWLGEGHVADLSSAFGSILELIEAGEGGLNTARRLAEDPDVHLSAAVELMAPIPRTRKNVFCVGRNYVDHVAEGARAMGTETKLPQVPQFFTKAPTAINAPGAPVRLDNELTKLLDYEVELAVVIGKAGRDIPRERAFEHVFGYTIANDVTARDLQRRHEQWFKGKSLDTSLPLGPWIVDAGEIGDPTTMELSLTVNGEERQHATVSMMIFDIPAIIASLSAGMTLDPGDVIATGTPSGVGFAMTPPQGLKDGDVVVARIDRIGELTSPIKAV